MKLNSFNSVIAVGYVLNFKIFTFDSGKKKADITIKDELTNNIVYATLFDSANLKYGDNPITLMALKNTFLDADDKPRHVLIKARGKVSENSYTNKAGHAMIDNKPLLFKIMPETDESKQGIIFNFRGIVDAIKEINDGDSYRIRLGIINYDRDGNPDKIEFNTVVVSGEQKEKLDDKDIEKYCQIEVGGDILNLSARDKYGISDGEIVKEMRVMSVAKAVTPSDDLDGFDDIYIELKKGNKPIIAKDDTKDDKEDKPVKPNKVTKPKDDDEDDLDF